MIALYCANIYERKYKTIIVFGLNPNPLKGDLGEDVDAGDYIDMGHMNRNAAYCAEQEINAKIIIEKQSQQVASTMATLKIEDPLQQALVWQSMAEVAVIKVVVFYPVQRKYSFLSLCITTQSGLIEDRIFFIGRISHSNRVHFTTMQYPNG